MLDRRVCMVVALGCVVTLTVTALAPRWFWAGYGDYGAHRFWIENTLAILTVAILATGLVLRGTTAFLRLALALPLAHLAAIVTAWAGWSSLAPGPGLADARAAAPILTAMPVGATTLGTIVVCLVAGRLASRRRDWLHGTTVFALASLLAVGLWLPIAASWYCGNLGWYSWQEIGAAHPYRIAGFVLVPPAAAAFAYTLVLMRAPELARRLQRLVGYAVATLLLAAIIERMEPPQLAMTMYGNFVHVLAAQVIAVIATFAMLALGLLFRARRARALLASPRRGTVVCDGAAFALELTSWLRGPRYLTQPFTIRTARQELVVPAGVEILAPVPAVTTQMKVGDVLELARPGDEVVVGGFVDVDPEHPFRGSVAALPGDRGLVVARADQTSFGDADLALILWRPCVAYLMIAAAIALPGLVAALAA